MAEAVYILCALTSLACAGLLLRSWLRLRAALLFWSVFCFVGLAINNALLFVNTLTPIDLTIAIKLPALIGLALFVFGLIRERE